MDMFNTKDRRNPSMDDYMNPKKPSFGGPNSKKDFDTSKRETLKGYQRVIDRNADFEGGKFNHNYDPTWKAVTRDLISRTAKKKPFDPMYAKPTIATVDAVEEGKILRFEQFVNEDFNMFAEAEEEMPANDDMPTNDDMPSDEPVIDEEQLATLMEEFGDDLKDIIEDIAEKMEMDKEDICDLVCAAVKKLCTEENDEDENDDDNAIGDDENDDDNA